MESGMKKALVVLSGGQDSTTCLYWAIREFGQANVETITFDYGQRHRVELECASKIAADAGVPNTLLPINTFAAIGGNALTDEAIDVESDLDEQTHLPNTFVPGRNLIFLSFVAAHAYTRGIKDVITGVAQTDFSGYPDCREETMKSLEQTLALGMEHEVTIHTPLMHLSKKETVELAVEVGGFDAMADTHTCYNGARPPCGVCPACELRQKGFYEAGVEDPLLAGVLPKLGVA
jgi:7-cyano-7-deazaguanine synthase